MRSLAGYPVYLGFNMGIFSRLFGSDKIIDAGISGIDAMVFTDEEQSSAKMAFLKLYEPYKIAQRWLMSYICIPYMGLWSLTGCILMADVFMEREFDVDKLTAFLLHEYVGTAFVLIVCFYFGGGAAEGVVNRFKK